MVPLSYSEFMRDSPAQIVLTLDTKEPIELGDFVAEFTALGNQFSRYVKENHPDLSDNSEIFVKEIKPGSIEAYLIPLFPVLSFVASSVGQTVIEEFVRRYGSRLLYYLSGKGRDETATQADLRDFHGTVAAIARDPDGKAKIAAAVFENGKTQTRVAFQFNTKEANTALEVIEQHRSALVKAEDVSYARVLMVFTRSDVKDSPLGQRSGERVIIEDIFDRDLPLIYASDLAEQRIKHEVREADENVFKKGFIVDVNVQRRGGRPVGYRVITLHQVIDLDEY